MWIEAEAVDNMKNVIPHIGLSVEGGGGLGIKPRAEPQYEE